MKPIPPTRENISEVQKRLRIPVTGILDSTTFSHLKDIIDTIKQIEVTADTGNMLEVNEKRGRIEELRNYLTRATK